MADKQEKENNPHAGHRQRMKQRFVEYRFKGMQQHEILELLLYYAIPRKDTNPLAHRMLERYGSFAKVCDTPVDMLQRDFGLSESAAVLLNMIPELARTYAETKSSLDHIDTKNAPEILRKKFIGATIEKTAIALADSNDKLLLCEIIAEGSVSATESPVRKIVNLALQRNAKYVYMAHNHPSEMCVPSRKDVEATHNLSVTLDGIGVILVDHLIITSNDYFSIRSHKQLSKVFVNKRYEI